MRTNNDRKMILIREKDEGDRFYICLSILMGFLLFIPIFCLFVPQYVPPQTNKRFFQRTLTASASIHGFTAPVSSSKSPLSMVSISDFSSFVVSFWEKLRKRNQIKKKAYDKRSRVLKAGSSAQFFCILLCIYGKQTIRSKVRGIFCIKTTLLLLLFWTLRIR